MAEPKRDEKGIWRMRIRYKDQITNDWKEKRISGKTRKEVKAKEADLISALSNSERIDDIKLLDYYEEWKNTFKKGKVSNSRYQKIELVKKNLESFFGENQTLKGINKIAYQKFINHLAESLSKETVSNRHAIVRSMFLEAYDMGYIRINPTRGIKIGGTDNKRKGAVTLSMEHLRTLKNYLTNDVAESNVNLFVLTQLLTGARYQEVAALEWLDIDFNNLQIDINKAYDYATKKRIKEPKSFAGYRKIDISEELAKTLKRHKVRQSRLVLQNKIRNPRQFVFVNNINGFPISNSFVNRYIKDTCLALGIPVISSHSLRHARTDFLILSGADPLYVKNQLGHEDYNTTLKHYASLNADLVKKSREAVMVLEQDIL